MTYAQAAPRDPKRVKGGAAVSAAALAIATAMIASHEGEVRTAVIDHLGKGDPVTWCYGETGPGVRVGQRFTHQECLDGLRRKAKVHADAAQGCLPSGLPDDTAAALYDFAYNAGPGHICNTRAYRPDKPYSQQGLGWYAAQGDLPSACAAISRYTFSKDKDCRIAANRCGGIVRRRADERALCERGLR